MLFVYKIINANLTSIYFLLRDGTFINERSIARVSWIMRMALLNKALASAQPSESVASSAFLAKLSLGKEDRDERSWPDVVKVNLF